MTTGDDRRWFWFCWLWIQVGMCEDAIARFNEEREHRT